MNIIEQYLHRSQEIIGNRTKDEERYDKEVLKWLRKGKNIKKAVGKANDKYPKEGLKLDPSNKVIDQQVGEGISQTCIMSCSI